MKKNYSKPSARLIDYKYDEQVVATSVGCAPETVYSQSDSSTCQLRDGNSTKMALIGCDLYLDEVVMP